MGAALNEGGFWAALAVGVIVLKIIAAFGNSQKQQAANEEDRRAKAAKRLAAIGKGLIVGLVCIPIFGVLVAVLDLDRLVRRSRDLDFIGFFVFLVGFIGSWSYFEKANPNKPPTSDNTPLSSSPSLTSEPNAPSSDASASQQTNEIREYAALHADGIISDEEFAAKKKQLLGL